MSATSIAYYAILWSHRSSQVRGRCRLNHPSGISRRRLLAGAAAACAYSTLPSWASGVKKLSPNDKANIAFIGIGNYGAQNLVELASQNIVAVCDVDRKSTRL